MAFPATYLTTQTAVAAKLRLTLADDSAKIKDWINQTYADVAQETRCFQQTGTSTLTAGTKTYTLSTSVLHIIEMTVTQPGATVRPPLQESSVDEILRWRSLNSNASGPPQKYALLGLNQLELWPTPSTADTLTTIYTYLPTALSADADVPGIPEPFGSKLLEYGALVQGAEWKKDILMLGEYQQSYQSWLAGFQRFLNRRQGSYPRAFTTWTGNTWRPNDPSVDIGDLVLG